MKNILLFLFLFLMGCSAFQPKQQELVLMGDSQIVTVNDKPYHIPATVKVNRDEPVTISKKDASGAVSFTKTVTPVLSTWGKLDNWGVYFLIPGFGLFTPGAYELSPNQVYIP